MVIRANFLFRITGVAIIALLFFYSCNQNSFDKVKDAKLERVGGIVVNNQFDQPELIMEGLRVDDAKSIAYGIDVKHRLPFRFSLRTGDFHFLGKKGRGAQELAQPSLLAVIDGYILVYDTILDMIAYLKDDEVESKIGGFSKHGIWLRGLYGYYWNGHLITAIKEPDKLNALDFDQAIPIALLNLSDSTLTKAGRFSPTLDELDSLQKYPLLALNHDTGLMYYVFRSDYTVMKLDLESGETTIASSYKPLKMRIRTISFDHNNAYHYSLHFSKQLNEDRAQLIGVDLLKDQLIVVHQNMQAEFLDNRDPKFLDYFGVVYDLPDLSNPREFTLPGKLLGTWGNRLLIEENDDVMEYTIGFYEFTE